MKKVKKIFIVISLAALIVLAVHTADARFGSTHSLADTLAALGRQQAVAYSCSYVGL